MKDLACSRNTNQTVSQGALMIAEDPIGDTLPHSLSCPLTFFSNNEIGCYMLLIR